MLRSNAPCLSNSYSSFSRHLTLRKCYSSVNAVPVGSAEFLGVLKSLWPKVEARQGANETNYVVGLAVSGGVDSMALATLYAKARTKHGIGTRCHGLIIDHKVRPGSTEEAEWIAQQLRAKFDMQATILPLTWPTDFNPSHMNRFESEARKLRYRMLGNACRRLGIRELMVAHHADDQAETVLMRLIKLRLRIGLKGMGDVEWIPECEGLYGVHRSGSPKRIEEQGGTTFVEGGGVQIIRPLLDFEKRRLIATCEEAGTQWVEDKTNHIPTFTTRNAIRHVFRNHKLPEALSVQSLVQVSRNMRHRLAAHQEKAEEIFNSCPMKFNVQTGALVVRLPAVEAFFNQATSTPTEADKVEAINTACFFFERLAQIVSPAEKTSKAQLVNAILAMYPTLSSVIPTVNRNSLVALGVWFRRWELPSVFGEEVPSASDANDFLLSRQPMNSGAEKSLETIGFPPGDRDNVEYSPWHLFDGRYWIRVKNWSSTSLVLRMLTRAESEVVATSKNNPTPRSLSLAYSRLKPRSLGRNLPALFQSSERSSADLVAFPTLGATIGSPSFQYEIRYKEINPGTRGLSGLMRGTRLPNILPTR